MKMNIMEQENILFRYLAHYFKFIDKKSFLFFDGLNKYLDYMDKTPDIKSVILLIKKERIKKYKELNDLERKTTEELKKNKKKIFNLIEEKIIKVPLKLKCPSKNPIELLSEISDLCSWLNDKGCGRLTKIFLTEDSRGTKKIVISKNFESFFRKYEELKKEKKAEDWGMITRLMVFKKAFALSRAGNSFEIEKLKLEKQLSKSLNQLERDDYWETFFLATDLKKVRNDNFDDVPLNSGILFIEKFRKDAKRLNKILKERIKEALIKEEEQASKNTPKLTFYPDEGTAVYKTTKARFSGKQRAILEILGGKFKNVRLSVELIKEKCNPFLKENKKFKGYDDIDDTIRTIRKKIKVKKSEYFPIEKREKDWFWRER